MVSKYLLSYKKPEMFGILSACAFICLCLTVFTYLAPLWWVFDLCCHFHLQYAICFMLFLAVSIVKKKYLFVGPAAILIVTNLFPVVSLYANPENILANENKTTFSVMMLNVEAKNTGYQKAIQTIKEIDPDILLLEEFTHEWRANTKELNGLFPYSFGSPQIDCSGNMMYSKYPLEDMEIKAVGLYERPTLVSKVLIKGRKINIVGTHPVPPIGRERAELRNGHLLDVARITSELNGSIVLLGDFNTTPFSNLFKMIVKISGLNDSMQGYGPQLSWPAWYLPINPFLIPIDHCLVSKDIKVLDRTIGPYAGSDHYPLILQLAI